VVGRPLNADSQPACFDLLSSMSRHLCFATSAVAASGSSFKAVPVVTLGLDVAQRELIYEVHQIATGCSPLIGTWVLSSSIMVAGRIDLIT